LTECEYGEPQRWKWKIPLKAGDVVKKGQFIRAEQSVNYTDDQVRMACADYANSYCVVNPEENIHPTYIYVSNEKEIWEFQLLEDKTIPEAPHIKYYLLVSPIEYIWENYKVWIIAGILAAAGLGLVVYCTKK